MPEKAGLNVVKQGLELVVSRRCEASQRRTACHPTRSESMIPVDIEQPEDRMRVFWTAALVLVVLLVSGGCDGGGGGDSGTTGATQNEDTYTPPDGTWNDPTSGLTWQVTPTGGAMIWPDTKAHCAGLSLDGGGWRLPSIGELRTLTRGCPATEDGGSCNVEEGDCLWLGCWDDSCGGCPCKGGPGEGGIYWPDEVEGGCCWYWSSTPAKDLDNLNSAWYVDSDYGGVYGLPVSYAMRVRCVRTKTADCEDGMVCEVQEEDTVSARLCTPGVSQDCICENGSYGTQTCLPDGLSWSLCFGCIIEWTDPTSGLTWQVEPTGGTMSWSDAKAHCNWLSLYGEGWHLPTVGEFRTLIRGCPGTITGGSCSVTDDCLHLSCNNYGGCFDCSKNGGPADGCYWPDEMQGTCGYYWSKSMVNIDLGVWGVGFDYGDFDNFDNVEVYYELHVRCVR